MSESSCQMVPGKNVKYSNQKLVTKIIRFCSVSNKLIAWFLVLFRIMDTLSNFWRTDYYQNKNTSINIRRGIYCAIFRFAVKHQKLNVWCDILGDHITETFLFRWQLKWWSVSWVIERSNWSTYYNNNKKCS